MQQLSFFTTTTTTSPSSSSSPAQHRLLLRELPESEHPHRRLQRYGAAALSNAELVELVTGSGETLGREVLTHFGGLTGLARASLAEIQDIEGLGPARAARIKAALELGRRLTTATPDDRYQVRSPADVAKLLMPEMGILEQEQLRVVLLNTKMQIMDVVTVYVGNVNSTIVRPAELFREAVRVNTPAIVMVHNHPSGDPTPSLQDIEVTRKVVQAGRALGIEVFDHLIIGTGRYVSLKERGLGFE